jgi:hypothetical protein
MIHAGYIDLLFSQYVSRPSCGRVTLVLEGGGFECLLLFAARDCYKLNLYGNTFVENSLKILMYAFIHSAFSRVFASFLLA